ncbi:hypothetical protein HQ524_01665 [Candidatus Uhrbacteria bacterium]|nr:hypothetical protein [Candidatus Uhrbacteria bacterium]
MPVGQDSVNVADCNSAVLVQASLSEQDGNAATSTTMRDSLQASRLGTTHATRTGNLRHDSHGNLAFLLILSEPGKISRLSRVPDYQSGVEG